MDMFFRSHPQSERVMNLVSIYHRVHKLIHELQTEVTVLKERPSALRKQTRRLNIQTLLTRRHFLVYNIGKFGKSTPYSSTNKANKQKKTTTTNDPTKKQTYCTNIKGNTMHGILTVCMNCPTSFLA